MPTDKEVAEWMVDQFNNQFWLYQEDTVYKIKNKFGTEFVYQNENGNYAISKKVLKEFKSLTEGKIVWERGQRAWRKLKPNENYKGRQVE
ncbi:MAG: membrane protein [Desulfobulbaceae bacterium BRH_c16a]|nr:MAG: membrane protein [Desulfobulbaceae bacterium BRH_c16a]